MIEVLLEKNRNMYLDYFKLTKRELLFRRLRVMAVFSVLFGVIYYLYHDTKWLLFLFPLVLFVGYKLPYYELLRIKSKEGIIKEQMFPTFLRYFIALIGTQGNVYRTLRSVEIGRASCRERV